MKTRYACAILVSVLMLALAGVSLAGETLEGQSQPEVSTDGEVSSIIFAVSTGAKDGELNQEQASLLLIKPLLASLVGTSATADVYKMNDDATPYFQNIPLKTLDNIDYIYRNLAFNAPTVSKKVSVEGAFKILCQCIMEKYTTPEYISNAKKVELWLVDRRAPLYRYSSDNIQYNKDKSDNITDALGSMQTLLNSLPGLEVHFVYLLNTPPEDIPERIDNQLRQMIIDPQRVMTNYINTEQIGQTYNDVMNIVKNEIQAVVPCDAMPAVGEKVSWSFTYTHEPSGDVGDALLLLRSGFTIKSLTLNRAYTDKQPTPIETTAPMFTTTSTQTPFPTCTAVPIATIMPTSEPANAQPDYIAAFEMNKGWLLLKNAPAGDYTVTLTLKGNVKNNNDPPVMEAYQVMAKPVIHMTYQEDGQEKEFTKETKWNRADYTVSIDPGNVNLPIDQWQISLFLNNAKAENIPIIPVTKEGGRYQWQAIVPANKPGKLNLSAVLEVSSIPAFHSETVSANVTNRQPEVKSGIVDPFVVYFGFPGDDTEKPFEIDISNFFVDQDKDPLTYTCQVVQSDAGLAEIQDNKLKYTPRGKTQDVTLIITATDQAVPFGTQEQPALPDDGNSIASFTVTVHQISLTQCLDNWRFAFDPTASQDVSVDVNGTYLGTPGKDLKLSFTLVDKDNAIAPFLAAVPGWDIANLQKALTVSSSSLKVNNMLTESVPVISLDKDKLSVTFQKVDGNTTYTQEFKSLYNGYSLPNLVTPFTLMVVNTLPTLRDGVSQTLDKTIEIKGPPWDRLPVSMATVLDLDSIDLGMYFTDKETPESMSFKLVISGNAAYELFGHEVVYPSGNQLNEYTLTAKDGKYPMDLTLLRPGSLQVVVVASDAEDRGNSAMVWKVRVVSAFARMLLIIGLCLLALLLLTAALLVLRYHRLPSFKGISVAATSIEDNCSVIKNETDVPHAIALDVYGKKSVSLLTLMMLFQLPPIQTLNAAIADDILIHPAHKAIVAISFGRRAARQHITLNGSTIKAKNKPFAITSGQLEIKSNTQASPEGVFLTFQQSDPHVWNM